MEVPKTTAMTHLLTVFNLLSPRPACARVVRAPRVPERSVCHCFLRVRCPHLDAGYVQFPGNEDAVAVLASGPSCCGRWDARQDNQGLFPVCLNSSICLFLVESCLRMKGVTSHVTLPHVRVTVSPSARSIRFGVA